jgi:hypothetical protein
MHLFFSSTVKSRQAASQNREYVDKTHSARVVSERITELLRALYINITKGEPPSPLLPEALRLRLRLRLPPPPHTTTHTPCASRRSCAALPCGGDGQPVPACALPLLAAGGTGADYQGCCRRRADGARAAARAQVRGLPRRGAEAGCQRQLGGDPGGPGGGVQGASGRRPGRGLRTALHCTTRNAPRCAALL